MMVLKVVLAAMIAVFLPFLQSGMAQAGIIAIHTPSGLPDLFMMAQQSITTDNGAGDVNDGVSAQWQTEWPDWSFTPSIIEYTDPVSNGSASVSLSTSVTYTGSSLMASGSSSASSDNSYSPTAGSVFQLTFTPAVDCTYHLAGLLSGGGASVSFRGTPTGGQEYYLLPFTTSPNHFDLTGQLITGNQYFLNIGVGRPLTAGSYDSGWEFNLSVQPVPAPSALLLLGSGLLGLGATGLRRHKRS